MFEAVATRHFKCEAFKLPPKLKTMKSMLYGYELLINHLSCCGCGFMQHIPNGNGTKFRDHTKHMYFINQNVMLFVRGKWVCTLGMFE